MKTKMTQRDNFKFIFILILAMYGMLVAQISQAQNGTTNKEKMQKLSDWAGKWSGSGWMMDESRQTNEFTVEENIQLKLEGRAILAEGKGTNKNGEVGFQSLGIFYYNNETQRYEIKSLLANGNMTLATAEFNDQNQFVWGFDVEGGRIQYTITITKTTWNEKGEFIIESGQAFPIMEMNLIKVK